jgi:D-alanyl-D-alanine carboxypeptidase
MDITVKGVWNAVESFKDTDEYKWLMKNAQDYGFILRYAKEKEGITEVKFEPWHWRYVGVEEAKKIKASGKSMEEYLGIQ